MADYLVLMTSGRVVTITGVTATPTLVQNDGVTQVKSVPYRDLFSPVAIGSSGTEGGYRRVPVYTAGAPPVLSDYTVVTDDMTKATPTAPKQTTEDHTHWKFVVGSFAYFIPFRNVLAMGTGVDE